MDIRLDSPLARQTVTPLAGPAVALPGSAADAAAPPAESAASEAHMSAVTHIEDRVQNMRRELRFRVDETTGLTVVRVVDAESGTLIRQIPSQEVLDMHKARAAIAGQLLREQA